MRPARTGRIRHELSPALGLMLLSALWAVAWLLPDLIPHSSATNPSVIQAQATLFTAFTIVAASVALARRLKFPRGRRAWACAGISIGLFVIPAVLATFAQALVSRLDQLAVLSLTPVFAVVLEPHLQDTALRQGKAALAGALAAVAGILFLFPLDIPASIRAGMALCGLIAAALCVAATNCLAVRLAGNLEGRTTVPMAALAGAASSICFIAATTSSLHTGWRWKALPTQLLAQLLVDIPALFLLFWLMRRLSAARMTARFLVAPLFTILAGIALQPVVPPLRAWLGLTLLAAGAGWIVFAPADQTEVDKRK